MSYLPVFVAEPIRQPIAEGCLLFVLGKQQHGMIVQRGVVLLAKVIEQQVRRGWLLSAEAAAVITGRPGGQLALLTAEQGVHTAAQQAAQRSLVVVGQIVGGGRRSEGRLLLRWDMETGGRGAGSAQWRLLLLLLSSPTVPVRLWCWNLEMKRRNKINNQTGR